MSIYKELVELLLPEDLLNNFEIVDLKKEGIYLRIYLEEKKNKPEGYDSQTIRANGFAQEVKIQDFPLRDKLVTLHVKRRRWLLVEENKKITRDLSLKTPGTRLTKEFSAFLKAIPR